MTELVCADIAEDAKARENGIAFVEYSDILHSQDQYHAAKNHAKGAYDVKYYRSGLTMGHQYHCSSIYDVRTHKTHECRPSV